MDPVDRPGASGAGGIAAARLIRVPTFVDDRGALGVVEAQEIPFAIERIYFLYRVPEGKVRGDHGHRTLQQVFIPLSGRCTVVLHDGFEERAWMLEDPSQGLYVPPMMWRRVERFSDDGVCLIVASKAFDRADYFMEFDRYVQAAREARGRAVKFLDVGWTYHAFRAELDEAVQSVLDGGWFLNGAAGASFEAAFAAYCGTSTCVGVANGLDALELTLRAAGCGPGHEVIVPAHTFIATWLAVSATGATIIPVDADATTMNLDLAQVAAAVSPRTRAVVPVHLYGAPADVDAVRSAVGRPVFVLEDAAQAHGARLRGRRAGSLGDAAAFSFYPAKNLGAFGDGGAVTTADADLGARVRRLANYGATEKYVHIEKGRNSRLDEIQAAVLSVKLQALDRWNDRRRAIARRYLDAFAGIEGLDLPAIEPGAEAVWHLFVVRSPNRDRLAAALEARGVPVQLHYPIPPHLSQAYAGDFRPGAFPVAEVICATCLSLPIGPHLTDAEVEQVCAAVQDCARAL